MKEMARDAHTVRDVLDSFTRFLFGHPSLTWDGKVQDEGYLVAAVLGLDHSEAHRPARLPDFRLARLPRSVGARRRMCLVVVNPLGAVVDGAIMAVNEGGDVAEKEGSKTWTKHKE
jgi:hypothetical protein